MKHKIFFGENKCIVSDGTVSIKEAIESLRIRSKLQVMLCRVNGKLRELSYVPNEDCNVELVTLDEKPGLKTYERGITFVFLAAAKKALKRNKNAKLVAEYGIGRGLYFDLYGAKVTDKLVDEILKNMKEIVDEDIEFTKESVPTADAAELFGAQGMKDKEKLLKFRRSSNTNIYHLGEYVDYFYGYMPPTTGSLTLYDVKKYKTGLVLVLPDAFSPNMLGEWDKRDKLFDTLQESNIWANMLGISTVGDLNEMISRSEAADFILMAEALQEKKIAEIAEKIKAKKGRKFIMIAGPSSSGKTSFSHRLSIQLRLIGYKPHAIALDDYYKNRIDTPKNPDGSYDFECLEALDVEQFNKDMVALLNGETVNMPSFNFKTGSREYKGNYLTLGPEDVLVIEGIHGLNDKLSYSLPNEYKFKIYISALTQLNIDEHNRIPTTDCRLLRRIIRDARTRGTLAKDTIKMWPSVRAGEEKYIFPFQEGADVMFNSSLIYELGVIKQYADPLLFGIGPEEPEYEEAKRLLKFLEYFLAISPENIPNNSLCREFVGGSCFNV